MARPTKYDPQYHPQLAKWMTRSGQTLEQTAAELHVGITTLKRWMGKYPEFRSALKEPKNFVDSLVEDSLLKRALGYEIDVNETTQTKDANGKSVATVKKSVRHIPPSEVACIFWLKNRLPSQWRDKPPEVPEDMTETLQGFIQALTAAATKAADAK